MTSTCSFPIEERGKLFTDSYRLYFKNAADQVISPFHDIPLKATTENNESSTSDCLFNMVVEVPKWSNAKMEISKSLPMNPILQDVKKGKVRFVGNVFPHRGYIWNYGAFPQTWEDPMATYSETGTKGDNDPLDVCDISNIIAPRGSVIQVKVLGVLLMIDEGETDWKVMAINSADPLAQYMEDISDVEKYKPGLLHATIEWFKYYKVPDGKPTNAFGFKNQFKNKKFALDVIAETNEQWIKLLQVPIEDAEDVGISRSSITVSESPFLVTSDQSQSYLNQEAQFDAEPAAIEERKALDSFFINGSTILEVPVKEVITTEMHSGGDAVETTEGTSVEVENGDHAPEIDVAEESVDDKEEETGDDTTEALEETTEEASAEKEEEESSSAAEPVNGVEMEVENGSEDEQPSTEEAASDEVTKDKPAEILDEGAAPEEGVTEKEEDDE